MEIKQRWEFRNRVPYLCALPGDRIADCGPNEVYLIRRLPEDLDLSGIQASKDLELLPLVDTVQASVSAAALKFVGHPTRIPFLFLVKPEPVRRPTAGVATRRSAK